MFLSWFFSFTKWSIVCNIGIWIQLNNHPTSDENFVLNKSTIQKLNQYKPNLIPRSVHGLWQQWLNFSILIHGLPTEKTKKSKIFHFNRSAALAVKVSNDNPIRIFSNILYNTLFITEKMLRHGIGCLRRSWAMTFLFGIKMLKQKWVIESCIRLLRDGYLWG